MKKESLVFERAVDSDKLDERIHKNQAAQQVNLIDWIFDYLVIKPSMQVLELCAGTGNQTQAFLKRVPQGRVVAVDYSESGLQSLRSKMAAYQAQLECICCDMDDLRPQLELYPSNKFDLIFCAYGLYYSKNPLELWGSLKKFLKKDGCMVVVGPFGPNNQELYDLLEKGGVSLDPYVLFTSRDFMPQHLFMWASRHFTSVKINTLVNPVVWNSPQMVLDYWKNSTFYEAACEGRILSLLEEHFKTASTFVNNKWIMMMEMTHERME